MRGRVMGRLLGPFAGDASGEILYVRHHYRLAALPLRALALLAVLVACTICAVGCVKSGCKRGEACEDARAEGASDAAVSASESKPSRMDGGSDGRSDAGRDAATDEASSAADGDCSAAEAVECYRDADGDGLALVDAEQRSRCGECLQGWTATAPVGEDVDCDDALAHACGECATDVQCPGTHPVCSADGLCVECAGDEHCGGTTPVCKLDEQRCVECQEDSHCADPLWSRCVGSLCLQCHQDADCAGVIRDRKLAETCEEGACVECRGVSDAACGGKVCDSLANTCSEEDPGSAGVCEPCLSDRHCAEGMYCVEQLWDDRTVGHFCLWRRDETGDAGQPNGNCADVQPYQRSRSTTSLDNDDSIIVCDLAVSTCAAVARHGDFCSEHDDGCGFDDPNDGICRSGNCRVRCTTSDDCPAGDICGGDPGERRCP